MWWFIGIMVALIVISVRRTPVDRPASKQHKRMADEKSAVSEWSDYQFNQTTPAGDWVHTPKITSRMRVVGTSHRRPDARYIYNCAISNDMEDIEYGLNLSRDPTNTHDRNSIKVYGRVANNGTISSRHIGFIPKEAADHLASTYRTEMPIAARLLKGATNGRDYSFTIHLLVPPAAVRKQFELN